jgi:hypothetical protein
MHKILMNVEYRSGTCKCLQYHKKNSGSFRLKSRLPHVKPGIQRLGAPIAGYSLPKREENNLVKTLRSSVADPDPGCGAPLDPCIRDPRLVKNRDPDPG